MSVPELTQTAPQFQSPSELPIETEPQVSIILNAQKYFDQISRHETRKVEHTYDKKTVAAIYQTLVPHERFEKRILKFSDSRAELIKAFTIPALRVGVSSRDGDLSISQTIHLCSKSPYKLISIPFKKLKDLLVSISDMSLISCPALIAQTKLTSGLTIISDMVRKRSLFASVYDMPPLCFEAKEIHFNISLTPSLQAVGAVESSFSVKIEPEIKPKEVFGNIFRSLAFFKGNESASREDVEKVVFLKSEINKISGEQEIKDEFPSIKYLAKHEIPASFRTAILGRDGNVFSADDFAEFCLSDKSPFLFAQSRILKPDDHTEPIRRDLTQKQFELKKRKSLVKITGLCEQNLVQTYTPLQGDPATSNSSEQRPQNPLSQTIVIDSSLESQSEASPESQTSKQPAINTSLKKTREESIELPSAKRKKQNESNDLESEES